MRYDLGDCTLWEYMFLSNEKPQLQIPEDDILDGLDEDEVRCSRIICILTARKYVCGKVMFSQISVCSQVGNIKCITG